MTIETWLAFVAASSMLLMIPGPTILLVVSYALGQGWRTALPMSIGVALGDFTAMTLSMLGIGALLAASATVFTALKWIGAAYLIYLATLGPVPPVSATAFLSDVFTTGAGWAMIGVGMGVGFLFALAVLAISVVSFPLLLDRDVGVGAAISTSVRAVMANPGPMAAWGLIVAAGLAIGSIPLFLGLIVVMPVLGHATWHLYRKVVAQ